jgi:hypothetical protein
MDFKWQSIGMTLALALVAARGEVVINEIFYRAPNDIEDLQFVELHNSTGDAVDLSGWKLARGIEYSFPEGSKLVGQGYLVLAGNSERFQEYYGFPPTGTFKGTLSRKGMRVDLLNAQGKTMDSVKYKDDPPWPAAADGYSASMERICPSADGNIPQNWASSPLPEEEMKPAGTPGEKNASFSASLPPLISHVKFAPASPKPGEKVEVEAEVQDGSGTREVTIRYRIAAPGGQQEELSVPMTKTAERRFGGTIPGQKAQQLVRFRIHAVNEKGAERFYPGPNEARPAFSYFIQDKPQGARIPLALIINTDPEDQKSAEQHLLGASRTSEEQQVRMYSRMQLELVLELSPLWFELAAVQQTPFEQLSKLRPLFVAKAAERDRLIREPIEAGTIKEARETIPKLADAFHQDVASALKPLLNDEQNAKAAELLIEKKAPRGPPPLTPDALLRRFLKLEDTFFKLTTQTDLTEPVFKQVTEIYRAAVSRRGEVTPAIQALMQGRGELADVRRNWTSSAVRLASRLRVSLPGNRKLTGNAGSEKAKRSCPDRAGRNPRNGRREDPPLFTSALKLAQPKYTTSSLSPNGIPGSTCISWTSNCSKR